MRGLWELPQGPERKAGHSPHQDDLRIVNNERSKDEIKQFSLETIVCGLIMQVKIHIGYQDNIHAVIQIFVTDHCRLAPVVEGWVWFLKGWEEQMSDDQTDDCSPPAGCGCSIIKIIIKKENCFKSTKMFSNQDGLSFS